MAIHLLWAVREVDASAELFAVVPSCCRTLVVSELIGLMLLLMRKGIGLLPLFLASSPLLGDEAGLASSSKPSPRTSQFKLQVGAGFAQFNGIIIPQGSDGRELQATSQHNGVPLNLNAGWQMPFGRLVQDFDLSYMNMINSTYEDGNREAAAGLARINLDSRSRYWINRRIAAGLVVILRRNFFKNRSESHVLDAVMPGFSFATRWDQLTSEVAGYYGVYSQYGFNSGKGLSNESLGATDSSVYGFEWNNFWRTSHRGSIVLGLQRETAEVRVSDIDAYESHGFSVSPFAPPDRTYLLNTNVISIGFRKAF